MPYADNGEMTLKIDLLVDVQAVRVGQRSGSAQRVGRQEQLVENGVAAVDEHDLCVSAATAGKDGRCA